jgi:arylsulfatase A-like enzyme
MRWMTLFATALPACNTPDVPDEPLPTPSDTSLPLVGTDVLKFRGAIPKNLIFMSVDTLRKDHLGTYGNARQLTPFLDRIASEGMVMDDHMQCSCWTFGSTTCTLAGRSNIERGHIPRLNGTDANRPPVPVGTPFLATWLGEAGYYSVIVSANDWLSSTWGNTQGYDEVIRPGGNVSAVYNAGTKAISEAIDLGKADRWFMHLHFMEPHASYNPPEEFVIGEEDLDPWPTDLRDRDMHYASRDEWAQMPADEQELLKAHLEVLYDGEIRSLDAGLEDIWENLEREGYLNDTLVVIWNDHGEQFWEHGHQTHAYGLNREENDGILLFWSRNISSGRHEGPTAAIDLVPTVLDLFGEEKPVEVTGYAIGDAPDDRPRFAEALARLGGVNSVQRDGLKLQYLWTGGVQFYDRSTDPNELVDLYDPADPRVLDLWSLLRPQAEAMAPLVVDGYPAPNWPSELP